ncbi:MAG TPA: TIGR02678 family protein, partial [Acidimicrobiales bacterium]|nr:TIGR02678 family protein [Acidimicrobiales bacterium]
MAEAALAEHLAWERSRAARSLLAMPLLDAGADPESFRLVVRHASWLADYFETTCGWPLTVDAPSGFARLAKRSAAVDVTRPLRRTRGEAAPFDRRRYQLVCLVCAELVRQPHTTVGLLAAAVTADAGLDTSRHRERLAFVDALRALMAWGVVRASAGEVDAFVDSERANALLSADTARVHRLLVSATAPSALAGGDGEGTDLDVDDAIARLLAEPRYGDDSDEAPGPAGERAPEGSGEARNRWARHHLGRRLLDDPVTHADDLAPAERDYLAKPSGRRWIRDRVAEAGFELEERAEGLLAVDTDAVATDRQFPAPMGNAHQLALLLVDRLVPTGAAGERLLGRLSPGELRAEVDAVLARFPAWARGHREGDGPERLAGEAVALLVSFGLARRRPDGPVGLHP